MRIIYTLINLFTLIHALYIPDCNKKTQKHVNIKLPHVKTITLRLTHHINNTTTKNTSPIDTSTTPIVISTTSTITPTLTSTIVKSITPIETSTIVTSIIPIETSTTTSTITPTVTSTVTSITPIETSIAENSTLENDCVSMHNQARSIYNPLAQPLVWDTRLAFRCEAVAQYCATISQTHFDLGDNSTTPGVFVNAQNLFITQTSCSSSYDGWVTNEVDQQGGHYLNIINNDYSRVGCAVSFEGVHCICCDLSI